MCLELVVVINAAVSADNCELRCRGLPSVLFIHGVPFFKRAAEVYFSKLFAIFECSHSQMRNGISKADIFQAIASAEGFERKG